jgi:hypothetical protein
MKSVSTTLSQLTAHYAQFKNDQEAKAEELANRLRSAEEWRDEEVSKVNSLLQQLADEK